jgi:hypothetical protein
MAHNRAAASLQDFEPGRLTRRQLIQSFACTTAAAAVACGPADAQVQKSDANEKVRATLETLVRDTPEIGLQVAAYQNGKLVIDCWSTATRCSCSRRRPRA